MKTLFFFLLSSALASPLLAAKKTELKIGLTQEFDNLNPIMTNMLASTYPLAMITRRLMIVGPKGEHIPQLVTRIPTLENGLAKIVEVAGKKKILSTWKFRKKARWGDGKPVTCEDLKFSIGVALNGKIPVPNYSEFEKIEKVTINKKDPKTCRLLHREAHWDFNLLATVTLVPKHLEAPVFQKYGQKKNGYTHNTLYVTQPTNKGLYSGPYTISEIKESSHMVLDRNPYFYGEPAKIDRLVIKFIPNTATLEANLRSGTIDMISTLGFTFDQALKFQKSVEKEKLPYTVHFQPSFVYEHIDVNLEDGILKDHNVRKALRHATDTASMSQALFEGRQPPALHFVSPNDPWFENDPKVITKYRYSPRRAKKLLEASGWKLGKDGYRYKKGKKLEITIMSTAGRKLRELVQVFLQEEWKKIGVSLVIKNFPARVFFGEYTRQAKFPHLAMYSFVGTPESSSKAAYHSAFIPRPENNFSGTNRPKWKNKKVDRLFEQLDREFSQAKRKEIMSEIQAHYTKDIPAIPLFYRSDVSVTPKALKGYQMTGNQFTEANFVENWELR